MKKIISILTTLVLALQLTTVFADGVTTGTPALTVNVGEIVDGKFDVTVDMSGVNYWSDITFEVNFDDTAIALTKPASNKVKGYDVWEGEDASITFTKSSSKSVVPQYFNWISPYQACTYSGTMVSMTFKVLETAVPGKTYDITVQPSKGPEGNLVDGTDINFFTNKSVDDELDVIPFGTKAALGLTYVSGSIKIPGEPEPEGPTMNATKSGSTVSIVATPDGESFSGKFIVAGYDAEGLVAVEVLDAAATATATINADTVKVMWWDSLTGLNSIVPADTDMAN